MEKRKVENWVNIELMKDVIIEALLNMFMRVGIVTYTKTKFRENLVTIEIKGKPKTIS